MYFLKLFTALDLSGMNKNVTGIKPCRTSKKILLAALSDAHYIREFDLSLGFI